MRVDRRIDTQAIDGRYIGSSYILIAAGPPRLQNISTGANIFGQQMQQGNYDQIVYPIAGTQAFNLTGNKALQRLFEIGSHRSYWLPSHTVQQLMLNRVYYHDASLLRLLYAYYSDQIPPDVISPLFQTVAAVPNPHDVIISPGYENIYLNLASDLFDQPFGLMLYIKDSNENTMAAFYLEGAMIPNFTWATDSMGGAVQESGVVQFEWMVPVQVNMLALSA